MPLPALLLPGPRHVSKLLRLELRLGRRAGAWRTGVDPCRALGPQPTWRGAPLCGRSLCEPLSGTAQMQETAILSSSIFSHGGKVCHTKSIVPGLAPSGRTRLQRGARSWGSWLCCFPSRPWGAWGLGTPGLVPPPAQGKPVHIQELVLRGVRGRSEPGAHTRPPPSMRPQPSPRPCSPPDPPRDPGPWARYCPAASAPSNSARAGHSVLGDPAGVGGQEAT